MRLTPTFYNQGTSILEKPVEERANVSFDSRPSTLFGTHEYIASDYNKKTEIHKVLITISKLKYIRY